LGIKISEEIDPLTVKISELIDFVSACYENEEEGVVFLPYSGEVLIASSQSINDLLLSDFETPECQTLCSTLEYLGLKVS